MKVRKLHRIRNIARLKNGFVQHAWHISRNLPAPQERQELPRLAPLREAVMMRNAKEAVLEGAKWLTATQVGLMAGLSAKDASARLNNWERDLAIFSVRHGGMELFPEYAIDPGNACQPHASIKRVLEQFGRSKDGWQLAFWFESVNSFLGGKRPMDFLTIDSDRVVAAAADEVMGVLHS